MKVVVLATDSSSTWIMVNTLLKNYPDLHVVIEHPVSRVKLLKHRIRKVGLWVVIGQILFMLYLPILRRLTKARIVALIENAGLSTKRPSGLVVQQFDSVNSHKCIAWLASEKPDAVVLNGTRIVSPEVLSSYNAVFLNTHCGITPAYRGVHGGYWALYKGDKKNLGVTVHHVDEGIDTGDIVYQEVVIVDQQDNFLTYPVKQYIAGIMLMVRALSDVKSGRLSAFHREVLKSAGWMHPTRWLYGAARWQKGSR